MEKDLNNSLVVGVSSRALFDLSYENTIFETEGVAAYCRYQVEHENEILPPGPGFALVKALLSINALSDSLGRVEVVVMSHNSPDTSLRVFNAIAHHGLDISRAVLVSGASLAPYLTAFKTDLFLSADEGDVQAAIDSGVAAGMIYCHDVDKYDQDDCAQIRIAFDGDAVLFSNEAEMIFKKSGLSAFTENEYRNAKTPLPAGPFARFLKIISDLQAEFPAEDSPIRTALVTARCAPAHERVIRTLRSWNVRMDEAFFLGGLEKQDILRAFKPHIFFDDQEAHAIPAARFVPSARVPYRREAELIA